MAVFSLLTSIKKDRRGIIALPLIIIGVVVVVIALWLVGFYNGLVTKRAAIDNQWAQVETQYQRRFDLIPNLVNSTEAVLTQERQVFSDIADARTRYAGAQTPDEKAAAATNLESALGRLLVIVENYPQLKSNETVQQLMDELAGTENRISVERRRYNDEVRNYNVSVQQVPGSLVAPMFGFTPRSYFESAPGAETAPRVDIRPGGQ